MLNYKKKDKIKIKLIKNKMKQNLDIIHYVRRIKWNWAGHVGRITHNRCTYKLTFWYLTQHIRKKGHEYTRWTDDFKLFLKYKQYQQLTTINSGTFTRSFCPKKMRLA